MRITSLRGATWLKYLLVAVFGVCLITPPYVFFNNRGGLGFLEGSNLEESLQLLFPLLGLIAFTLVTFQVLIGSNRWWLRELWPGIMSYHRMHGMFALLFAALHPLFILIGYGLITYLAFGYTSPDNKKFVLLGTMSLIIMFATTITALMAWHGRNLSWWKQLHRLNYLVFAAVWLHSWSIGSDTGVPSLRTLWIIYLLAVIISFASKYLYGNSFLTRQAVQAND